MLSHFHRFSLYVQPVLELLLLPVLFGLLPVVSGLVLLFAQLLYLEFQKILDGRE